MVEIWWSSYYIIVIAQVQGFMAEPCPRLHPQSWSLYCHKSLALCYNYMYNVIKVWLLHMHPPWPELYIDRFSAHALTVQRTRTQQFLLQQQAKWNPSGTQQVSLGFNHSFALLLPILQCYSSISIGSWLFQAGSLVYVHPSIQVIWVFVSLFGVFITNAAQGLK